MEMGRVYYEGPASVPATAIRVKVTHVLNPFMITIVEMNNYLKKFNALNLKLQITVRRKKLIPQNISVPPKPGDTVIGRDLESLGGHMPCYLYRGLIEHIDTSSNNYNVFLIDYGTAVQLRRDQFIVVPFDFIPNEQLSSTIGLYNIVPCIASKNAVSGCGCNSLISENWSRLAIEFLKEFITASNSIYFDCLAVDEFGRKYGDLYLDMDDKIVSLCKSLVLNHYAEYLEDIHDLIKHPNEQHCVQVNENYTIFLSHSKNVDIDKESKNVLYSVRGKFNAPNNKTESNEHDILPKSKMHDDRENILIYGSVRYKPVNDVADVKFPAGVHEAWNTLVNSSRPKRIQSYFWPAIKKFSNVIAIGVQDSGKTFGYTAAVSALLAVHKTLPQGNKPSALILCSSTSQVLIVHSLFTQFLQNYDTVRVVAAFNGKSDRSLVAEIYSGCQVLVTTPPYLVRFMNRNKQILNFEWLWHLVVDHADVILHKYYDAIGELFTKYKIIANRERQYNDTPLLQIIMVARHCTQSLKKTAFILMDEPYICIGSFIEACVFKSIRPSLLITNSQNKQQKVLGELYSITKNIYRVHLLLNCKSI